MRWRSGRSTRGGSGRALWGPLGGLATARQTTIGA
ncbi:unnamed protein product [Linum tenue]|uniref:Uncharacterized protein n=1 Tax=Linum tenue TaxID=586396 RepID=A0AAV0NT30_9ROSI|nr:unnamed protein product [Linum tenue]